jgi:hypothetical protein
MFYFLLSEMKFHNEFSKLIYTYSNPLLINSVTPKTSFFVIGLKLIVGYYGNV